MFKVSKLESGFITKYAFEADDIVIESVLYRYEDRTVICISTQCGCKVGCKFCGTGSKFVRDLTSKEICEQVRCILDDLAVDGNVFDVIKKVNSGRFQIMFMSMGEPFHNYENVRGAIAEFSMFLPKAELLISTIGVNDDVVWNDFIKLSCMYSKIGLQFSIHKSLDGDRDILIPYDNKLKLSDIAKIGERWSIETLRPVYLNYCVDGSNCTVDDANRLKFLFNASFFNFTFSVVCSSNESIKDAGYRNLDVIKEFESHFSTYNTRIFNPEAQDDIGGGCGQLWQFQKFIKEE